MPLGPHYHCTTPCATLIALGYYVSEADWQGGCGGFAHLD